MATYAPELSSQSQGHIRHQPLGKALREYAGTRNKQSLIRLLSPVQRSSETSALIRELVESGDLYHPLAWTPAEAYEFLKETPLYEQCGVIVRLPNWWKQRTRPQVNVTIGSVKLHTEPNPFFLHHRKGLLRHQESGQNLRCSHPQFPVIRTAEEFVKNDQLPISGLSPSESERR